MTWAKLLQRLISETCRGSDAEFVKRTGLTYGHLSSWRNDQDMTPRLKTIQRIEEGLGVRIVLDANGVPQRFEAAPPTEQSAHELAASYRARPKAPGSPREEYEALEFAGGKPDWLDLPDVERGYYEALFRRMEDEIDQADTERDERVRKSIAGFRNLMRDRMLGIR